MLVDSAIQLIGQLTYKPGWTFEPEDHTNRFEGSVKVKISYPANDTSREDAREGYPNPIPVTYAVFSFGVSNLDDIQLYREIANCIMEIECHEMREFLRVSPTFWAPFHPHQLDGMRRWNPDTVKQDFQFGIA